MRRSYQKKGAEEPIHVVSAFAARQRMVLGQTRVGDKSNEIIAIPALLELLAIEGAVVTIDAMGCQRDIAQRIIDKKADYLRAKMLRRPFLELRRFARADLNLVAVFEKPRSQRLTHNARADHGNFHDVLLRPSASPLRSAAPANSRGTGQGSPQGRSPRFDPQMLELAVRLGQ